MAARKATKRDAAAAGTGSPAEASSDLLDDDADLEDAFEADDELEDDELEDDDLDADDDIDEAEDELAETTLEDAELDGEDDGDDVVVAAPLPPEAEFDDDEDDIVAAVAGDDDADDDAAEIDGLRDGEFVCRSCFMAKRDTQLADPDRLLCRDCA